MLSGSEDFLLLQGTHVWSQYQHGGARLPVTPVPADLYAFLVSVGTAFMECTYVNPGFHTGCEIKYLVSALLL